MCGLQASLQRQSSYSLSTRSFGGSLAGKNLPCSTNGHIVPMRERGGSSGIYVNVNFFGNGLRPSVSAVAGEHPEATTQRSMCSRGRVWKSKVA